MITGNYRNLVTEQMKMEPAWKKKSEAEELLLYFSLQNRQPQGQYHTTLHITHTDQNLRLTVENRQRWIKITMSIT